MAEKKICGKKKFRTHFRIVVAVGLGVVVVVVVVHRSPGG